VSANLIQQEPTTPAQWESCLRDNEYQTREACEDLTVKPHLAELLSVLPPGSRIVEAGCGLGQYVYMFASLGHCCIGLDYSQELIKQAQQRGSLLTDIADNTEWLHGDILDLPIDSDSLDCYASFGVLEHFSRTQQRQILAEAHRVLKPGGILYQYVPNFWSPWTIRREIRYRYRQWVPPKLVWQRNIRQRALRAWCRQAGFVEQSLKSYYAAEALRTMRPPRFVSRLFPRPLRQAAYRASERLGNWCDQRDLFGYGLVYIGSKPSL
jgi:ubiquinone/menaquinone biosynthesis C-methylase UbiE